MRSRLARAAPSHTSARNRVSSYSVWETAVFVLNVLAFVLMGLQARPILSRLSDESRSDALVLAAAVLATVILVRLVWVLGYGAVTRLTGRRLGSRPPDEPQDVRGDLLIGWCGMRGLVTLATAFALPADFPGRDQIVLTAFCVVFGTLVLQGMTLKPLLRLLRLEPDQSIEQEVSRARVAIMQAALDSLDGDNVAGGRGGARAICRRARSGGKSRQPAGRDRARRAAAARDRASAAGARPLARGRNDRRRGVSSPRGGDRLGRARRVAGRPLPAAHHIAARHAGRLARRAAIAWSAAATPVR